MSGDQIVLDMATQSEGAASIFVKKDWLSILDNQNKNYQGSQSIIDTSQLANSNKYMNYREAYVTMPLTLTLTGTGLPVAGGATLFNPAASAVTSDFPIGLKNWYGSIIHSFTLDYNGTTIIQQTPLCGLYNTFKLMTSLSLDDLKTQGSLIGFYPDTAQGANFSGNAAGVPAYSVNGSGLCNNTNGLQVQALTGFATGEDIATGNTGFLQRQNSWCVNPLATCGPQGAAVIGNTYMSAANMGALWNSYVSRVATATQAADNATITLSGIWQASILAVIKLKHVHSFFERVPLLKGVFMKLTFNLNQPYVTFSLTASAAGPVYSAVTVVSPLGGVNPLMLASAQTTILGTAAAFGGDARAMSGASRLQPNLPSAATLSTPYTASLTVGNNVTAPHQLVGVLNLNNLSGVGSGSIMLNVPAYTFNPVFESSYLASPVKKIVYTDIYQYQIINQIQALGTFNNLITNGIANIKSVLCVPFYSAGTAAVPVANSMAIQPIYSPFDTAGGGTTSPWIQFNQFNIQVSGQNAIYNTERYGYEQFVNQLAGYGAINGGQEDGLTSGLIGYDDWKKGYSYYYVNCGRMLPVEEAVPKSVNVIGNSASAKPIDLYVFIEYGVEVSVDILTGARV